MIHSVNTCKIYMQNVEFIYIGSPKHLPRKFLVELRDVAQSFVLPFVALTSFLAAFQPRCYYVGISNCVHLEEPLYTHTTHTRTHTHTDTHIRMYVCMHVCMYLSIYLSISVRTYVDEARIEQSHSSSIERSITKNVPFGGMFRI